MLTHAVRATLSEDELVYVHRTVLVCGEIDERVAQIALAKMLYLKSQDARAPVWLYLDSAGGNVGDVLAICDLMGELVVHTHCLGAAHAMALVCLAHGARGHRSASRTSRFIMPPLEPQRISAHVDETITATLARDAQQAADVIVADRRAMTRFDVVAAQRYGLIDAIAE